MQTTQNPIARAIGHDPDLFKLACGCVATAKNKDLAALDFLATLLGAGITKTHDGHRFSYGAVRAALNKI